MSYNLSRKVVVLAGLESEYGTNPGLTPAANTIWSFDDMNPAQPDLQLVERQPIRGSLTKYGSVVGRSLVNVNPKCVLQGSGVGATEPYICRMLRGCGLQAASGSTGGSTSRILTPRSSDFESLALEVYYEKILTEVLGCYGSAVIEGNAGAPIDVTFALKGLYPAAGLDDSGGVPTGMVYPPGARVQMQNEGLAFGAYADCLIKSFRLDLGTVTSERPDANSEYGFAGIIITDRAPKMNVVFEAEDDLTNYDFFARFQEASITDALSLTHGSVALGSIIKIEAKSPQIRNVQWGENNGLRTYVVDLDLVSTGDDDELKITFTDKD